MNKAVAKNLGYIGVVPGAKKRDSDSWYTPEKYLESARNVLNGIELDPFSSVEANVKVKASRIFTEKDNALNKDWATSVQKSVWMNPPYGKLMKNAIDKFVSEFKNKKFESGIVLCNNATDTKWFAQLVEMASALCFTNHRIQFENIDGKNLSSNTRGQIFVYFGTDVEKFNREFIKYGLVVIKYS